MAKELRLGVNIDHVATIRNARGGVHPDPLRAAKMAAMAGADFDLNFSPTSRRSPNAHCYFRHQS